MEQQNAEDGSLSTRTFSSTELFFLLFPQALVGFVDAISFMIVAPSLIFYVRDVGGDKEQYGVILAAFSLASCIFKPVVGYWSDKTGLKFRLPYLTSIAISAMGALLYFFAGAFHGISALGMILLGRFLSGMGAANNMLGFSYIATLIPSEAMTQANALLTMVRVLGLLVAPGINIVLHLVNFKLVAGSFSMPVNELNGVGLFLLVGSILNFVAIYLMLDDPTENQLTQIRSQRNVEELPGSFWKSICRLDILVPLFALFSINANFQLLETTLAPAASDALGWGPVSTSTLFAINSILMFFVIMITIRLSGKGVSDMSIVLFGLTLSFAGHVMVFCLWKRGMSTTGFIISCKCLAMVQCKMMDDKMLGNDRMAQFVSFHSTVTLAVTAFPLLVAPIRSIFSRAVANDEHLRNHQGTMQAIIGMMSSIAGFTAPGLIAAFVLRTPEGVSTSNDQRELTLWALVAPALSLITLDAFLFIKIDYEKQELPDVKEGFDLKSDEGQPLLGPEA